MPAVEMCVVCHFVLPAVQRCDTRYCGSTCRVRAHRARRRATHRETWEELRRLYREIRERELIRPLSGRYPFPLRARQSIAALQAQIRALSALLAGERQESWQTNAALAETEETLLRERDANTEAMELLSTDQRTAERALRSMERELEEAQADAEEYRQTANETAMRLSAAEERLRALAAKPTKTATEVELARQLSAARKILTDTQAELQRVTDERDSARSAAIKSQSPIRKSQKMQDYAAKMERTEQQHRRQLESIAADRDHHQQSAKAAKSELAKYNQSYRRDIAALTKERDDARKEARQARTDLQTGQQQLQQQAGRLNELVENFRRQQDAFTIQVHRRDGTYNPNTDRLVLSKLDELQVSAELGHWQYVRSKRETARPLLYHKSLRQQAYDLAMAARWALVADPPKAYKKVVSWQIEGYVLDAESEEFLYNQSINREVSQRWKTAWLKPTNPKRRRRS